MTDLDAPPGPGSIDGPTGAAGSNLRDRAYGAFTRHLLSQDLAPGQFVSQRELVQLTGFPLGAIRELIPRLEAEGLIHTVPKRGMQIAPIDLSLIRQAFQFRLFIEREAIALLVDTASDAEIGALRAAHEGILARVGREPDRPLVHEAQSVDWSFHDGLVDALDNAIVSNNYRVNSIKIRLISQRRTRLQARLVVPVMQDHLKIIAGLEARDPVRAAAALTAHIDNARLRALGADR